MDDRYQLRKIMFVGSIGGAFALCLLFAMIGTISYIAWPVIIPLYHPYLDVRVLPPPVWYGTIIGGVFGSLLGWLWGLMDRDVGETILYTFKRPDWPKALLQVLAFTLKFTFILGVMGVLFTSLWL